MPTDWEKIDQIFHKALEYTEENRAEFLSQACQNDPELQREIQSLIATHEEDDKFMETPVLNTSLSPQFNRWQEEIVEKMNVTVGQMSGQVLDGKYHMEELRGTGGMGAVYRATHLGTGRVVAVKVMDAGLGGDSTFIERFRREAKTIGRLRHPHIVNITDFGFTSAGGRTIAYLVMEYLEGSTLAEKLKDKRPLAFKEAATILKQVGSAIDEAHRLGILHRDLKPENIWLESTASGASGGYNTMRLDSSKLYQEGSTASGASGGYNVKVLDFGIAVIYDRLQEENIELQHASIEKSGETTGEIISSTVDYPPLFSVTEAETLQFNQTMQEPEDEATYRSDEIQRLTRFGTVMGTPVYMSPEQFRGDRLDKSSDIYSLGVIAYEMLTGEPPFRGTIEELLHQHREGVTPSLRNKRPDVPAGVDEVVRQALSKERTTRPATAGSFAFMLCLQAGGGESICKKAREIRRQHWLQLWLIGARVNWIFWVICGLLLFAAVKLPGMSPVLSFTVFGLLWVAIAFLTILGQNSMTAACALFLERKLGGPLYGEGSGSIVNAVKERYVDLSGAIIAGFADFIRKLRSEKSSVLKRMPDTTLAAPTLINEGTSIPAALKRSETLVDSVRRITFYPSVRSLLAIVLTLTAWQAMVLLFGNILDGMSSCGTCAFMTRFPPEPFIPPILALATAIIFFIAFRMSLKSSIERAVLYLSARKARGEAVDELSNRAFTEINPIVHWDRGRIYVTVAFLIMLVAGTQYFKFESMNFLMERGAVDTVKALNVSGVPVPYWAENPRLNALWVTYSPQMLRYFVEKGAGINDSITLPPLYGSVVTTPLMSAIMSRSRESVRYLIRRGADLHAQDSMGRTPLMVAAIYNPQAIEQLITAGADVNQQTKQGTALQVAARYQWMFMKKSERTWGGNNAASILLRNGANPDVRDSEGRTPLMLSMMSSNEKRTPGATIDTAISLLTSGEDINARDNKGRTTLMYAVKYKRYLVITELMKKRADIKATDNTGMTAQKIAEQAGDQDIVRMLRGTNIEPVPQIVLGAGPVTFGVTAGIVQGKKQIPSKKEE